MTPERWKQIEEVYYRVAAAPASERARLQDELCGNDSELLREVESLLSARDRSDSFLSPQSLESHVAELLAEPELSGQALGHYQVVSLIGEGAMGKVYMARDTRLDRVVALKILPPHFTRDADRVARFRREAKAASALNHPNIITIYDVGQIGEVCFIASEFIEGVTLRQHLAAVGRMHMPELLAVGIQCALALDAAHRAGIIHRDVKPENIMLRPDGLAKVLDFGVARVDGQDPSVDATLDGTLLGTPRYMSPEQARGRKMDVRTDVFSLSAVLYEMATGIPAATGATTAEVFESLLTITPRSPSELVTEVPQRFCEIVLRGLEKDPEKRQSSMQMLASDLQSLEQQLADGFVALPAQPSPLFSARRLFRDRNVAVAAAAVLLFVAAGLSATWYVRTGGPMAPAEAPPLTAVPLTTFEGLKDFGALSPDGSLTAFSWNGGKNAGGRPQRNIYIKKTIETEDPIRLTFGPEDERMPAWSPDGRSVALCRLLQNSPAPERRYGVYLVPVQGGQERKVHEGGLGVSWSQDGKTLAVVGTRAAGSGILTLSLNTGAHKTLTNPSPNEDSSPVFSPDGRWIAFTRHFGSSARELFIIAASGGEAKQLTSDREPIYGIAWTPGGTEIVFASNRGVGGESLWRIRASGGTPRRVSATLQGAFYPSISREGDRLIYTESFTDTNIYAYDSPGFSRQFGAARRLIVSSRRDDSPSISPDGHRIAFVSKRTGNEEIWVANRDGGQLVQMTAFKGPGTGTPKWSPDGRRIVFDSLAAGNPDIYVMDADGGEGVGSRTPRRLTTGPHGNFMPSWSPDGQWIYFRSNRTGRGQVWKIPAAGGDATQVTRNGGSEAYVSPDGKVIYFTNREWGQIWMMPAEGGTEAAVSELSGFDRIFRSWGVVDRGIYFLARQDGARQKVHFFDFRSRKVTLLAELEKELVGEFPSLALSNDGRRLLVACLDQQVNDLMLIENFH